MALILEFSVATHAMVPQCARACGLMPLSTTHVGRRVIPRKPLACKLPIWIGVLGQSHRYVVTYYVVILGQASLVTYYLVTTTL